MAEILPSTAAPYSTIIDETETPNDGVIRVVTHEGEINAIDALRLSYRAQAMLFTSGIASLLYRSSNGRGTLTVNYGRTASTGSIDMFEDSVQELNAVDVVRDIKAAPYFESLSNAQMSYVQAAWDARLGADHLLGDLSKALYGHLAHGQDSYIETAYEFRQAFQTNSTKRLQAAASDPNTIQSLPSLSPSLKALIGSLPTTGQWLKKPTTVQYAGRNGYTVSQTYQWAPKWSVIYGATGLFTGLDAP